MFVLHICKVCEQLMWTWAPWQQLEICHQHHHQTLMSMMPVRSDRRQGNCNVIKIIYFLIKICLHCFMLFGLCYVKLSNKNLHATHLIYLIFFAYILNFRFLLYINVKVNQKAHLLGNKENKKKTFKNQREWKEMPRIFKKTRLIFHWTSAIIEDMAVDWGVSIIANGKIENGLWVEWLAWKERSLARHIFLESFK